MVHSAEFHLWRLSSPGVQLDVLQKIKALGFSDDSFYLNWALLEGEPGVVRSKGVIVLDEYFSAANEVNIYLWAQPSPYINSKVSSSGFPGWLQRSKGYLRSTDPKSMNKTRNYIAQIGKIISEAEITKGGQVILVQPENEHSLRSSTQGLNRMIYCLNKDCMELIENEYPTTGVILPMHNNDAIPIGTFLLGSGVGEVDIRI